MSEMPGGGNDGGRRPVEDSEIEALLTGGGTNRTDLAALDRFLDDLRAPHPIFDPQPTGELARLFAEGPGEVRWPAPDGIDDFVVSPWAPGPPTSTGRKPVRRLAKVAVVTTSAVLAVTLAAAAQVLPGAQSKTAIRVSGPAVPVRVGAGQSIAGPDSDVKATAGAGAIVSVPQPSISSAGRAPSAARPVPAADLDALSPEALARLPFEVLKSLSPENLAKLPVDVLTTLPGDVLARLSADVLRTLPADALAKLPADALRKLPNDLLAKLPVDVLKTLPGDVLARLPLDLLQTLPADVQKRLPADILRLLLLSRSPTVTASAAASVRP